jgi:iron complex outermembrane receptor protein
MASGTTPEGVCMRNTFIVAALAAAHCLPAFSQNDDAIVVTATRFADAKRDLAVGVSVITADDIRASANASLPEILAQYGLLHIRDNAGSPNQQLDLRGFGITGDQNTLVLVDGVRISDNEQTSVLLSAIPLESIERIEILRGSGAVLYGGGASGGTVNIITRQMRDGQTRAHALGRLGGYGTQAFSGSYARQGETFGASIAFSDEDTKGYRRNNRFQQTNLAGALEARLPGARAYLRFALDDQRLGLPGQLSEAQIASDPRQASTPTAVTERNGGRITLGGSWVAGRHEFSADLGYRSKRVSSNFPDFFGGFYTDTKADVWSFAPRAKFAFDAFGRGHDVVVGFDVERWDYATSSAGSPATIAAPFSRRLGGQNNDAIFGQANLWLGGATRLVLGSRLQRSRDRLAEEVFPLDDRRQSHTLDAHELGLRHRFGGGWSGYAKAGKSFRFANFDDNACFFPPCATTLLSPQTSHSAELGLEFERSGMRLRASLHEMRLNNEIYFSPLAGANINLSPTARRGFELETGWRPAQSLDLRAGLTLMQARFRSGVYGGVDVTGKDVPLVPDMLATAGASWDFAAGSRLNASLRYVGRQRYDNDQANTFGRQQPGYALVDLKLEQGFRRLSLALEVRNLFDKQYYSYGILNFAGTGFSAYPAPGRAGYLSVAYRLD